MDRCWKLRMEYMNSEAEEKLLRDTTPSVQLRGMAHHDWTSLMAKRLTKAANQIRKAYHTEGSYLGATMSTRSLLRFRDLLIMAYATAQIRDNDPMAWALRVALTEAADPASALAIHKIVEAEVGDLGKYIMTA